MKLRVFISILFIIATTISAVHEIEHITHDHDSSSCLVCTFDNHSVSVDIVDFTQIKSVRFNKISSTLLVKLSYIKDYSYQTRAPPIKS
jgi:hypothetical protein